MSIRLTIAVILVIFMIPVGHIWFSLPVAGVDSVEEQEAVRLFGFMGLCHPRGLPDRHGIQHQEHRRPLGPFALMSNLLNSYCPA